MCACLFAGNVYELNAVAVSLLNNELFVLPTPNSRQLEVYDAMDYSSRGTISIPVNFQCDFIDMAAYCFYHCLYIAHAGSDPCIVRLQLPSKQSKWSVSDISSETTLTVTSSHHLLVVCGNIVTSKSLKLFSTDGVLHKTVKLQPDLANLNSIAESTPGHYVITRGRRSNDLHQVCMINSEGEVLQTCGGFQGSYHTLMNTPKDAVVDKEGFVYVVEEKCNRLIVLTPQLDYIHCISSYSYSSPRLKIDNERRRLFIRYQQVGRNYRTIYTVLILEIAV